MKPLPPRRRMLLRIIMASSVCIPVMVLMLVLLAAEWWLVALSLGAVAAGSSTYWLLFRQIMRNGWVQHRRPPEFQPRDELEDDPPVVDDYGPTSQRKDP